MSKAFDMAITPWGVVGGGVLTGKYRDRNRLEAESKRHPMNQGRATERNLTIGDEVLKIADEIGRTPSQVAINWVRSRTGLMIPILGARTVSQMEDNLGCLDFDLAPEQLKRLDEVSRIELGFPHDFLNADFIREVIFGGTYTLIDNHRK